MHKGYRKNEIKNHYIIYPLIIALIGGIIGTILRSTSIKTYDKFYGGLF